MNPADACLPPIPASVLSDDQPVVAAIGNFDGVHRGHHALIETARSLLIPDPSGSLHTGPRFVLALAFHPHPATVLRAGSEPLLLSDWAQRAALLLAAGADAVLPLAPTRELLSMEPEAFFDAIVERYQLRGIVEGHDFHFGKARRGTPAMLESLAKHRRIAACIVPPVQVDLNDQTLVTASSTIVRWLLQQGRVSDAARVLGRPYTLAGAVVQGDRLGRTIGVPTANLATLQMLPADGVYAGLATLPNGVQHAAAIHVGPRATLNDTRRTCEAHLIGWAGPACDERDPEYGWPLQLAFTAWLRGQARFESLDAMVEQIRLDIQRAQELAWQVHAPAPHAPAQPAQQAATVRERPSTVS